MGALAAKPLTTSPAGLAARLATLRRYAVLVLHQAEALEDENLERFEALAAERARIQEALDGDVPDWTGAGSPAMARQIAQVRQALEAAQAADRAIQASLGHLRKSTAGEIRSMGAREPKLRRYLEEDGPGGTGRSRINIKL